MIKIFEQSKNTVSRSKPKRKRAKRNGIDLSKLGKENLEKVNPMAFGLLALKFQENPNNEFISSSVSALSERPHALTEKWIYSINKLVDSIVKASLLDPPPISEGDRAEFIDLVISKVISPKECDHYPMPAVISVDSRGWKYYFKTSKACEFKVGDKICFAATVASHKEGISFLRRPSKIRLSK